MGIRIFPGRLRGIHPAIPILDRSHPLTRGLLFLTAPLISTRLWDFVRGLRQDDSLTAGSIAKTPVGPGFVCSDGNQGFTTDLFSQAKTTHLNLTNNFSVWGYFYAKNIIAASGASGILSRSHYVSESVNQGWLLQKNHNASVPTFFLNVFNNNAAATYQLIDTTTVLANGKLYSTVMTVAGGNVNFNVNGLQTISAARTIASNTTLGVGAQSDDVQTDSMPLLAIGYWGRVLTQDEILSLTSDPFAILSVAPRRKLFFTSSIINRDLVHNLDSFVQGLGSPSHNIDADITSSDSLKNHNIDADVQVTQSKIHNVDAFVSIPCPSIPLLQKKFIKHAPGGGGSGTTLTFVATFTLNVTAGSAIVIESIAKSGTAISGVVDTLGNSYSKVFGPITNGADSASEMWLANNSAGGACTVTVTFGASTYGYVGFYEYGANGGSLIADKRVSATGLGGASPLSLDSGATSTTAVACELLLCFGGTLSADTITYSAGTGYTIEQQDQSSGDSISFFAEDQNVSSVGAYHGLATATGAGVGGGNFVIILQTFSLLMPSNPSLVHNVDAYVSPVIKSPVHNVDANIFIPFSTTHNVDCDVFELPTSKAHNVDTFISGFAARSFLQLSGNIIFPIDPLGLIRFRATIANQDRQYVQLAATVKVNAEAPVNILGTIQAAARSYVRLKGTVQNHTLTQHSVDAFVSTSSLGYVQMAGTIKQAIGPGPCGSFPDASYVNLRAWIVNPGDSVQMPNSGFTQAEDFLSSQIALAAYKPMSVFILNGIALIITAFTTGVQSWQTRTRSWLRRVDAAPGGILVTDKTNVHTLPNGAVITTNTQVTQNQDVLTTIITIQNSTTPTRLSQIITEKNKYGQTTSREIETININGNIQTVETKSVFSQPPDTENIQPLKVTTLDGVQHYQFFGSENTEWAGGDAEGKTVTTRNESINAGTLNGQSTDRFGNPILQKTVDEVVQTPDGKTIETKTITVGTREAGTTVTDTSQQFNGITTTTHKVVTYPDGSQTVTDTTTNNTTGDSTEVETEIVTDEYGQVTTTVTTTETKTFVDPTTGNVRTTETKNVSVTKNGVTTNDSSVDTTNDFEDDIVNQKVQVIYIQEFTITCVVDEMSMFGLWEINETHQKNFALLELFGQQLSNANLSYLLRQSLIDQFNQANSCTTPVTLQANGRTYQVVFAPSASGFRAKYIPGTEPHVYELQIIVQERSNLITGTKGFF